MMSKYFFLTVIAFLFIQHIGFGQDVDFRNQQEVDNFDTSITHIEGDLSINGSVRELSNLSNILSVEGRIRISNTFALDSLNGLNNIRSVGEDLHIDDNSSLKNLDGLSNINSIGGELDIKENDDLLNIDGLMNLVDFEGNVIIIKNAALKNLDGLHKISLLRGEWLILENDSLENLNGLNNITSFNGNLRIETNKTLQSFAYFDKLESIEGNLNIKDNRSLQNIDGLANLTSFKGDFSIYLNSSLQNIDGLSNLATIEGDFFLSGSYSLQNIDGLANLVSMKGDLTIIGSSLENIDALINLSIIEGSLNIQGVSQLQNLNGLENLVTVHGALVIDGNDSLIDLKGLRNLNSVQESFVLARNDWLQSLDGLQNLAYVGGRFEIHDNDVLINIDALTGIDSLGSHLRIIYNDELENLNGLRNLSVVNGDLDIVANDNLRTLDSMTNISYLGRNLLVWQNEKLLNIDGLSNLSCIKGDLEIENNPRLNDLDGLVNVNSVLGDIVIEDNPSLDHLDGLANIGIVEGNLSVISNNSLSNCCGIQHLIAITGAVNGIVEISDNPSECSSKEEILVPNCGLNANVKGCIYWDENQNRTKDLEEKSIQNISSFIQPFNAFNFQDTSGCFTYSLENGNYTISYNPSPLWQLNTDSASYNVNVNNDNHTNLDFGFIPLDPIVAGKHSSISGITRCFREVEFHFNFRNEGNTILEGRLYVELDSSTELAGFIHPADTILNDKTWEWHYDDLYPGEFLQRKVVLQLPGVEEDSISIYSMVSAKADFFPEVIFESSYNSPILCAYDPNDKLVSPDRSGEENYTLFDEDLTYTVRFQNTGNDTAFTVVIRDTLDNNLDASTFTILGSSHRDVLQTEISENKYMTFTFDNILLPDSTINFNGSQGYITYTITPKEGLDENTIIENTASIYFDFNPPIVTNTTKNTMVSCLPIEEKTVDAVIQDGDQYTLPDGSLVGEAGVYTTEILDEEGCPLEIIITNLDVLTDIKESDLDESISIYPNPTDSQFQLNILTKNSINHQLILTNIYGQIVLSQTINQSLTNFSVKDLATGVYFIQVLNNEYKISSVKKLMVK